MRASPTQQQQQQQQQTKQQQQQPQAPQLNNGVIVVTAPAADTAATGALAGAAREREDTLSTGRFVFGLSPGASALLSGPLATALAPLPEVFQALQAVYNAYNTAVTRPQRVTAFMHYLTAVERELTTAFLDTPEEGIQQQQRANLDVLVRSEQQQHATRMQSNNSS